MLLEHGGSEAEVRRRGGRTGWSIQDHLDRDTHPVPEVMRWHSFDETLGDGTIGRDRYVSRAFHDLEMERLWPRVWQMACHQDELPAVGDAMVYEIGDHSVIVVRTTPDEFKAYPNSCLHRGTKLCPEAGRYRELRCPFHAWTWHLDGTLKDIPSRWDFPQLDGCDLALPEVRVDTWGGFVFVNLDPTAAPLAEHVGDLPAHYGRWPLEDRPAVLWVRREVDCNWKAGIEAFIEGYHVIGTHPQTLSFNGDADSQYDTWPGQPNFSRFLFAAGVPGYHVGYDISEQEIADEFFEQAGLGRADGGPVTVPEGGEARHALAARLRELLGPVAALELEALSDSEVFDGIQYFLFPNLVPFGGIGTSLTYRFRPIGHDPNRCLFEIYVLGLHPHDDDPGRPRLEPRDVVEGGGFSDFPEFGILGQILDQDTRIMHLNQAGLRASPRGGNHLGVYQESRIRHLHRTLDEFLAR